jgi:hypothetical protein
MSAIAPLTYPSNSLAVAPPEAAFIALIALATTGLSVIASNLLLRSAGAVNGGGAFACVWLGI